MTSFVIPTIPDELRWKNVPLAWAMEQDHTLSITAGASTDLFIDPRGDVSKNNAPAALFSPDEGDFTLKVRVKVDFASQFDAGVLWLYERDDLWAKLCFEYSPQGQAMIVSVVTQGVSDDCNSVSIDDNQVYLRIARVDQAFAFHYSTDGKFWHLVRYFTLGRLFDLKVGFSARSPTGEQCSVLFSEINYEKGTLEDIRSGE